MLVDAGAERRFEHGAKSRSSARMTGRIAPKGIGCFGGLKTSCGGRRRLLSTSLFEDTPVTPTRSDHRRAPLLGTAERSGPPCRIFHSYFAHRSLPA